MRKLILLAMVVAMVALATVAGGSFGLTQNARAAGPWYVDGTTGSDGNSCLATGSACLTIQAAINKASLGDTINVAAGTYTEQLIITKGLTIVGDVSNPDNVVIDGQNSTTMLKVGQVRIYQPTGPVIFEGFKIVNTGWNPSDGSSIALNIFAKSSYPVTIQHNKLIGHGAGLTVGNDYGIWTYGNTGTLAIQDNYLSAMYHGILLERQTGASTIAENTFDALFTGVYAVADGGDGNKYGGRAIEAITYGGVNVISLQEINENQFVNFKSTGVQFSGGFSGQNPGKFTNVVIEDNNFDFATTDIINLNGAVFLKNVSGTLNNDPAGGVSANIHNNIVHVPSGNGINVAGLNGSIKVNNNSIAGNLYGLMADESLGSTIDATCNWWGAANGPGPVGPGTGDRVSTGVSFNPWLTTSDLSGPCNGGALAISKNQCKDGGWDIVLRANGTGFKNQGACVSYVEHLREHGDDDGHDGQNDHSGTGHHGRD